NMLICRLYYKYFSYKFLHINSNLVVKSINTYNQIEEMTY
ncbi:unnamed protein product, partial [marine sediment metagenome]